MEMDDLGGSSYRSYSSYESDSKFPDLRPALKYIFCVAVSACAAMWGVSVANPEKKEKAEDSKALTSSALPPAPASMPASLPAAEKWDVRSN